MPEPRHAPRIPGRQLEETPETAEQARHATALSPAKIRGTPGEEARGEAERAGVPTSRAEAEGEKIARATKFRGPEQFRASNIQNPPPGAVTSERGNAQVLRTMSGEPRGRGLFRLAPKPLLREIEDAHLDLIGRAERLIYIETQYLRKRRVVEALVDAGRDKPQLGLILVVPAAPMEVAFDGKRSLFERVGEHMQAHAARRLRRTFGRRAFLMAPLRPVPFRPDLTGVSKRAGAHGAEMVFVHSKAMTVDDSAAIVGSANLNGRSLRWDTEVSLKVEGGQAPPAIRRRLFAHWLPQDAPEEAFGLETAVEAWRRIALEEAERPPAQRRSFLAPYAAVRARRFGRRVPVVPEDFI